MNTAPGSAGYSGTPLAKKLGLAAGQQVLLVDAPEDYEAIVAPLPSGARLVRVADGAVGIAHVFATQRGALQAHLSALRATLGPDVPIWVSWPKKASKVPTDITEDTIRELAFPLGLVDVKVCAVTSVWSGLKLVVRKALR